MGKPVIASIIDVELNVMLLGRCFVLLFAGPTVLCNSGEVMGRSPLNLQLTLRSIGFTRSFCGVSTAWSSCQSVRYFSVFVTNRVISCASIFPMRRSIVGMFD
jgi:hypothetical protein